MPGKNLDPKNVVDQLIGNRIRTRRLSLGMDQEALGRAMGLTASEIRDYEGGTIRVKASRLSAMAEILGVPILFFFRDLKPSASYAPSEDQQQSE
jgi:transcriptional regulator with XRE-family HTH domain